MAMLEGCVVGVAADEQVRQQVTAEDQVKRFGAIVKSPDKGFPIKSPYLTIADQAMETMRKFMLEFGLTPSSRSRIKTPGDTQAADEFDLFVRGA